MTQASARTSRGQETRAKVVTAALDLFVAQGLAETTIDQIAEAAGVGRRTVFHHFPTKEAILFDHLVLGRDVVLELLRDRPRDEPPIISLYVVLRELCDHGYDRSLLDKIRAVFVREPQVATVPVSMGLTEFELEVIAVIEERMGPGSALQARALTYMALGWTAAAAHVFLGANRDSLVECFDEAVEACLQLTTEDLRNRVR